MHRKKGAESDVTMSYFSVCKRWGCNNAQGHNAWQATEGGASGTGGHSAATVSDVGGWENLDYYLIPFIS